MRKLLTILGAVGLTATSTATVVACGNTDKNGVVQSGNLNSIVKQADRQVSGTANMSTATKALNAFLATDAGKKLMKDNVQVKDGSFIAAQPNVDGSFTIVAKSNTKYTGELVIAIKGNFKFTLEGATSVSNRTIQGTEDMKNTDALNAFLAIPANSSLKDEVEIKSGEDSFVAPTSIANGKLVIQAKSSSVKYIGELTIAITTHSVGLTNLESMITTKTIDGSENMTQAEALEALATEIGWSNLGDFVTVASFETPKANEQKNGQLVLEAKTNTIYFGSVTITINY